MTKFVFIYRDERNNEFNVKDEKADDSLMEVEHNQKYAATSRTADDSHQQPEAQDISVVFNARYLVSTERKERRPRLMR